MIIRNINNNDLIKVKELIENCGPYVAPYNIYVYWILNNYFNSSCKVAVENNKIIGFVSALTSIEEKSLFIWQICVNENYRKRNIGLKLIDEILKVAQEMNIKNIDYSITEENNISKQIFRKYAEINKIKMIEVKKEIIGNINEIIYRYEL